MNPRSPQADLTVIDGLQRPSYSIRQGITSIRSAESPIGMNRLMGSLPIRACRLLWREGPTGFVRALAHVAKDSPPLKSKHPTLIALNSYRHHTRNRIRYDTPVHPFKTLLIEPSSITHRTGITYSRGLGRVGGGGWDESENLHELDEHPTFAGLKQRFEAGREWKETDYVAHAADRIDAGREAYGYSSVADFIEGRCSYVDDLFADIRDNGYRPASEHATPNGPGSSPHNLEPVLTIARDGTIHLANSGKHRFAIAQIFDLRIPCHVTLRHEFWQDRRDALYRGDKVTGIRS